MTPDDLLMLGTLAFVSGISGMGLGYYIRDVQMNEYIEKMTKNMEEIYRLADALKQKEKENDN